jgi:ankyrin repeat protein
MMMHSCAVLAMTLRATAPVFVPSFEASTTSSSFQNTNEPQKSSSRRRQKRRTRGKAPRTNAAPTISPHEHHTVAKQHQNYKPKKQHQKRRKNKKRHDNDKTTVETHKDDEILFPPLVGSDSTVNTSESPRISKRDWLGVAERAHEEEEEERRREAVRLMEQSTTTVKLTPLVRSSTHVSKDESTSKEVTTKAESEPNGTTERDRECHKLQNYVHVDMEKLRNRWWDLIREKNNRDYEERQRKVEELSMSSSSESSSEEWEEDLVETSPPDKEPEHSVVDPTVLETCLESLYPLHQAVKEDDEKAVRLLLQEGTYDSFVDLSQLGISDSSNDDIFDSFSPLFLAVYLDKPQLVKVLCDASANVQANANGRTALMLAAHMGLEGCITALLSCGVSLWEKDTVGGDTAIHYACRAGVESLALRALLLANSSNRVSLLKILSCKNNRGQTPLHVACEHAHAHIVEVFLNVCSSSLLAKLLQIRDDEKQTPLLAAVRAESHDIVMSLLMWRSNDQGRKLKAAGDLLTDDCCCPLSYAASAGSTDMVLLLLEFIDPSRETSYNLDSALQAAVRSTADTRLDTLRVLVNAGANPCTTCSDELSFPGTALSISCTKGDAQGLTVMLDSWERRIAMKRLARRQDPKLRQQPESYFAAIEAKENTELKVAMTGALLLSSFLGFCDDDLTSPRLRAAVSLFHRGAQLKGLDFAVLKASIQSGRLVSPVEAVDDGSSLFMASYRRPMPDGTKKLEGYDRSPLSFWSRALCSMPWMQACNDVQCAWMVVQRSNPVEDVRPYNDQQVDQVVLVTEEERFVVNAALVSQKSAKLAAAIRFEEMNAESGTPVEVRLGISARYCRWLLEHIYHGSIVSGWHADPLQCASDLMELACIAEEFICPTLLQECEMRLLSSDPFQCFCWSCCSGVRAAHCNGGDPEPCGECLYQVQGPSRLLVAERVLDALAVSSEMGSLGVISDTSIKRSSTMPNSCQSGKDTKRLWDQFDKSQSTCVAPFAHAKEAAIKTCLSDFVKVSTSRAFLSQIDSWGGSGTPGTSILMSDKQRLSFFKRVLMTFRLPLMVACRLAVALVLPLERRR